jgi:lysine 2,3-aminomutase
VTKSLTTLGQLIEASLIDSSNTDALASVAARYAVAITPELADLIDRNDPDDPIARQFVPTAAELTIAPEELADPIGDDRHSPVPGIVHRYRDRVLFKLTNICPVYCRFCFRREMVGNGKQGLDREEIEAAFAYIETHPEIWEVILTGGDPFVLSPRRVAEISRRLAAVPHVRILRWHSRVPVAKPGLVSEALVAALTVSPKTVYVIVHCNHPRELTANARAACRRLIDSGIPVLSQSVLLKGVNDDIDTLETLMRALVETGVKPYYLHHGDLVPGTSHFRTTIEAGQRLMRELRARVSGLCQPTYVLDIPGGYSKVRLESGDAEPLGGDGEGSTHYLLGDDSGDTHLYPPPPKGLIEA